MGHDLMLDAAGTAGGDARRDRAVASSVPDRAGRGPPDGGYGLPAAPSPVSRRRRARFGASGRIGPYPSAAGRPSRRAVEGGRHELAGPR